MIRPFTFLCLLLAGGAGLYLYQVKHRTRMLEIEIDHTLHAAGTIREQTGLLQAEWAFLNDPSRLAGLAEQQLALKPVDSKQFVQMADLDRRLPPVPPPPPPVPVPGPDTPAPTNIEAALPAVVQPAVAVTVPPPHPEPARPQPPAVQTALAAPPRKPPAPAVHRPAPALATAQAHLRNVPAAAPAAFRPPAYQPVVSRPAAPAPVSPPASASALGTYRASLPPPVPIVTATPATFQAVRSGR